MSLDLEALKQLARQEYALPPNFTVHASVTIDEPTWDVVLAALVRAERIEAALVELVRRAGDPDIVANAMGAGLVLASALRGAEAALEHPEE